MRQASIALVLVLLSMGTWAPVAAQPVDVGLPTEWVDLPPEDEAALQRLIDRTLAGPDVTGSLDWFWTPRVFPVDGTPYRRVASIHPYVTGEAPAIACAPSPEDSAGNALYCHLDQSLSYDLAWLRSLYRQVGPAAPVTLLAHEWGHHISGLLGLGVLSVRRELQADCYAGMFIRALVDNGGLPLDGFTQSLRLFASIGDDRGGVAPSAWSDPQVHGSGAQRRQAEGVGYSALDTRPCLAYNDWAEQPPIDLVGGVSLQLPPSVTATIAGDPASAASMTYELTVPGVRAIVELTESTDTIPSDVITRTLRRMYGDGVAVSLVPGGFLDARGWATGSGATATFTGHAAPGATGLAAIQSAADGIDRMFVVTSDDGMRETADALLSGLLWGYCDLDATDTANCDGGVLGTGREGPDARPTPRPPKATQRPPRPTPTPDARSTARSRTQWERVLVREAPSSIRSTCTRFRGRAGHDPFSAGAVAGMSCDVLRGGIEEYATFQFLDWRDLYDYYVERVYGVRLEPDDGHCVLGRGEHGWEHGRVACWVSRTGSRLAHIRWIDDRTQTYGVLDASDRDIDNLYEWWLEHVADD